MSSSSRLERLMLIVGMTDRLTGPLNKIQSTVQRVTSYSRKAFMNTAAGVTALMAASTGFAATINPANDMNMALREVRSLGVAESTLQRLNQAGLQYSIQFGESAQGYVRAAYDIQSAIDGLVNDDLPRFTTAGGTLAKATKANVGDITAYFGSMYGIFRNQANAMGKSNWVEMLAGRTATAVQMFKTTGPEMKAAFESLGADATSYGVSMAEQMAVLGNLQSTMSGSEAGTKYRAYLAGIAGAEQKLGLKFSDESGKLLPIVEVLNRIQGKFGDIDTLAKGDLLNKAFGSGEATAMLKLLSADIGKINGDITKLAETKGMDKAIWMAEQMQDPWARLRNGITAVTVAVYQKALPAIEPFIIWMVDGLSTLTKWTDKYPHLTKAVGLFAAGLFALVAVGGSVSLMIGLVQFSMAGLTATLIPMTGLVKAYGLSWLMAAKNINFAAIKTLLLGLGGGFALLGSGILSAVTATWSFTVALLANPITWIVLAVAALAAGIAWLVLNWSEAKAAFMDWLSPIMPGLQLIGAVWDNFVALLSKANPFALLGSALDWILEKINMIPGIDIDLNMGSVPEPKLPEVSQPVKPVLGAMPAIQPIEPVQPLQQARSITNTPISQLPETNGIQQIPQAPAAVSVPSGSQPVKPVPQSTLTVSPTQDIPALRQQDAVKPSWVDQLISGFADVIGLSVQTDVEQQRTELQIPQLERSTQAPVEKGGLMQSFNTVMNKQKTGHNIEKLEVNNHGEPIRGDQLLYEMEMMAP